MADGRSGSLGPISAQLPTQEMDVGQFDVSRDVIAAVQQRGIQIPGPPVSGYRGEMPANITSLDDEQLGTMMADQSQWVGYIEGQLAIADGLKKSSASTEDYIRARIRLTLRTLSKEELGGVKLSEKDKSDWVECDPKVLEAHKRALYYEGIYRLTLATRDKAQRDWETVSRRITQRGQDVQRQIRNNQVAGVPVTPTFRRRNTFGEP
jgi:hypothetical protein